MWDELACPEDNGRFERSRGWLSCAQCGRGFPVIDAMPHVFPADELPCWRAAQQARLDELAIRAAEGGRDPQASRQMGRRIEEWLRPHVQIVSGTRLVELGSSGSARLEGFRCGLRYGVDPLAGALAAHGLLRAGPVRWVAGSPEYLPLASGAFEVVLLCGALEQAADPQRVLAETRRVLAPHGVVWLEVALQDPQDGIGRRATRVPAVTGQLWAFTMDVVQQLIAESGLAAVERMVIPLHQTAGTTETHGEAAGTAIQVSRRLCRLLLRPSGAAARAAAA